MAAKIFIRWMRSFIRTLENKRFALFFNILVSIIAVFAIFFICISGYFFVRYGPVMLNLAKKDFMIEKTVGINTKTSIPITAAIKEINFPIKTNFKIPVDYTFYIPLEKPIYVPIDHTFHLNENIHITAQVPFNTTVTTTILGVKTTLPIKGVIPIDTMIPINHDLHVSDTIAIKSNDPIPVPVHHTFDVPVNISLNGKSADSSFIPSGSTIDADVTIKGEIPITAEFNPFYDMEECIPAKKQQSSK
jgi:hypothetical protein